MEEEWRRGGGGGEEEGRKEDRKKVGEGGVKEGCGETLGTRNSHQQKQKFCTHRAIFQNHEY